MSKNKDDMTIVVYGSKGVGKSSLIGEIADFLKEHDCDVMCVEGPAGGRKQWRPVPEPGNFHPRRLRVKIVEQVGDDSQPVRREPACERHE
jgi:signal recognition particle GTPase